MSMPMSTQSQASMPRSEMASTPRLSPPLPLAANALLTVAELNAAVTEAARSLKYRFEGPHAIFFDPFESKTVRVSMHMNQRRWRALRITKNGRALLAKESRLRALADSRIRQTGEETAAVAALEAVRRAKQQTDETVKQLAAQHAEIARATGSLKLLTIIDARYENQRKSDAAERAHKRQRLHQLTEDYRAKRRRLNAVVTSSAANAATAAVHLLPAAAAAPVR